jgi:ArsR family transcriptional regulator, arsenate/arsenite/antimonite-responsive transcriptional repressor
MDVEDAFEALSHKVRRDIASLLAEQGELSSGQIAERIGAVGRTTVSTHLRLLRTAGIVNERQDGRHRYYSVNQSGIAQEVLAFMQRLLHSSIESVGDERPDRSETASRRAG